MTMQTTYTVTQETITASALSLAELHPEASLLLDNKGSDKQEEPLYLPLRPKTATGPMGMKLKKIRWTQEEKEASYKEIQALLHQWLQKQDSEALEKLLEKIRPILHKSCRHFFGTEDEDLMQDGCLCAIQLIRRYDPKRENVKFLGYMKKMMMFFYWDKKKQQVKDARCCFVAEDQQLEQGVVESGFEAAELGDAVSRLESKQQRIVREHIMEQKQLNLLCREMAISYAYGKELKKKALSQLREDCFTVNLPKKASVKQSRLSL